MAAAPFIRDTIVIDESFGKVYDQLARDGPVLLVARIVRHAPGFVLRPPDALLIVADLYDGNGGMIDARGADSAAPGAPGGPGAPGALKGDRPDTPGSDGGAGGAGGGGGAGRSVTLISRRAVNVDIRTTGGGGAAGGPGGPGGRGVDGFPVFSGDPLNPGDEIVAGTPGGPGGPGGDGGPGGAGGALVVITEEELAAATLESGGGQGAPGGRGGRAGRDGELVDAPVCPSDDPECRGADGERGPSGDGPPPAVVVVTHDDMVAGLLETLGPVAGAWAEHRALLGEHFYRNHNAAISERAGFAALAAAEFRAALELQPDNALAARLLAQLVGTPAAVEDTGEEVRVGGRMNVLGLPRDLDLIPNFQLYIDAFTSFSDLTLTFLTIGTGAFLSASEIAALRGFVELRRSELTALVDEARDDLALAESASELAADEADLASERVENIKREIEAAMVSMRRESLTIGDVIGTVATVAVTVVAVFAAVTTGGASLIALVPSMVALTNAIADDGGPIVAALFEGRDANVKRVKAAAKEVGENAEAIVKATQSVIDFVKVVERLGAASRPDNAKNVALVRRGAELAHELLIAANRAFQADQRVEAARAKLERCERTAALAASTADRIGEDVASVRSVGLFAIDAARSKVDVLLEFAFKAQRSLEIYTLDDQEQNLLFDAGAVHPDTTRGYAEGFVTNGELLIALTAAWARLLNPIAMQEDYLDFFSDVALDQDVLRLSFKEAEDLQSLRDTGALSVRVDPAALPADRFDTKVVGVALALVGAEAPDGVISAEVWHLGRHEQRRADGSIAVQSLQARASTRPAGTERLELPAVDFGADPPLTAPQQLAFWGRGIGGQWEIRIVPDQSGAELIRLDGLSEVQLWLKYQFSR